MASRMKKTLRLLPTRSQLPSTVLNLTAKPRGSRAVSGLSLAPTTVEKRTNIGVFTPVSFSTRGAGVLGGRLVADLAIGLETAVRAGAAGMHDALGDPLTVEMGDLLDELIVLERRRSALADRADALVVGDRMALAGRQNRAFVAHESSPSAYTWFVMSTPTPSDAT